MKAWFLQRGDRIYGQYGWVKDVHQGALRFNSQGEAEDGLADLRKDKPSLMAGDVKPVAMDWHPTGHLNIHDSFNPYGRKV